MKFFLSHSTKDKDFVRKLAEDLFINGYEVWFDEWELDWGDSLFEKIEEGIKESNFLIIVISSNSIKSRWVNNELKAALSNENESNTPFILPILYDDCEVPLFLKDKIYIDFRDDYDKGIKSVISSIKKILGNPQYLTSIVNRINNSEYPLKNDVIQKLAVNIEHIDLNRDDFIELFNKLLLTDTFLLPFITYGLRFFSEQELLEMIMEERELPYAEHSEYAMYCAGFIDNNIISKYSDIGDNILRYAGFSEEESKSDINSQLKKLENDDVNKWINTVDFLEKRHKSRIILEVLRDLYVIGNGAALKQIKYNTAVSYRILTASFELLFNTKDIGACLEVIERFNCSFTTDSLITAIYKSIAKLTYSDENNRQIFQEVFRLSNSYTRYRILKNIDLFSRNLAHNLCVIGKSGENRENANLSNQYLERVNLL